MQKHLGNKHGKLLRERLQKFSTWAKKGADKAQQRQEDNKPGSNVNSMDKEESKERDPYGIVSNMNKEEDKERDPYGKEENKRSSRRNSVRQKRNQGDTEAFAQ